MRHADVFLQKVPRVYSDESLSQPISQSLFPSQRQPWLLVSFVYLSRDSMG